jgi:FkbM family methyltransferase
MKWRGFVWRAYQTAARPFVRVGITRLPLGRRTLGNRIDGSLRRVFSAGLPEALSVHGCHFHYRLSNGERHVEYVVQDYERETRLLFEEMIEPGMTVVDVGAHIGYFTLIAARRTGPAGRVYAFEPDPLNYELLTRNVLENTFDGIVTASKKAVTKRCGQVSIFRGRANTCHNSILRAPGTGEQIIYADAISLDEAFAAEGWPAVHVLKMDIEGAEKDALKGAERLIGRSPGLKLFVEFNPRCQDLAGVTAADFLSLLRELGFRSVRPLAITEQQIPRLTEKELLALLSARPGEAMNLFCEK